MASDESLERSVLREGEEDDDIRRKSSKVLSLTAVAIE